MVHTILNGIMFKDSIRGLVCGIVLILSCSNSLAFTYVINDNYGEQWDPDQVVHPGAYDGTQHILYLQVSIDKNSKDAAKMEIPVKNAVAKWNQLIARRGNYSVDDQLVKNGAFDFETVILHELGHSLGLGHPTDRLVLHTGSKVENIDFTVARKGEDGVFTYDIGDGWGALGADLVAGSRDDPRVDNDVNANFYYIDTIHPFFLDGANLIVNPNNSTNNPFNLSNLEGRVDSTTYTIDESYLKKLIHGFSEVITPAVSKLRGEPPTRGVMNSGLEVGEICRDLSVDDVAAVRFASAGLNEIAEPDISNSDDYKVELIYTGMDDYDAEIIITTSETPLTKSRKKDIGSRVANTTVPLYTTSNPKHFNMLKTLTIFNEQYTYYYNTASFASWRNSLCSWDVNNDNNITAIDVLLIINRLNLEGPSVLNGDRLQNDHYYDVNGDGLLTALDALQVVNYLNLSSSIRTCSGSLASQGEGEAPSLDPAKLQSAGLSEEFILPNPYLSNYRSPVTVAYDAEELDKQYSFARDVKLEKKYKKVKNAKFFWGTEKQTSIVRGKQKEVTKVFLYAISEIGKIYRLTKNPSTTKAWKESDKNNQFIAELTPAYFKYIDLLTQAFGSRITVEG